MRPLLCAFAGGLAVMGAEMTFARQVAPWFGSSLPVWAVLISTLLLALALGAAWGGRRTLGGSRPSAAAQVLLLAAAGLAAAALVMPPLLAAAADARQRGLALAVAAAVAALALAAGPVFLLGALNPLLLAAARPDSDRAGWLAGRLAAAATGGSLAGTLLTAFLTLPALGTRASALGLAGLCALAALVARGQPRPAAAALLVFAGLAVASHQSAAPHASGLTLPVGHRLLEARDTSYQSAFVLETADGRRSLRLNSIKDRHSVYDPRGPAHEGIWPHFLLAQLVRPGCATPPRRVLVLGLGAGTLARDLAFAYPTAQVTGVEIDPDVVALGRRWFALPASTRVEIDDGRRYLNRPAEQAFDLILVDAFAGAYLPFQLATRESFVRMNARLAAGGAVAVNVLAIPGERQLADAVARTMAAVFGQVGHVDLVPGYNTMLLAWRRSEAAGAGGVGDHVRRPCAEPTAESQRRQLRSLLPMVRLDPALAGGPVLTDDRAPVEWLTHRLALAALRTSR